MTEQQSDMTGASTWVSDDNVALLTDFYELTMLQAYWREAMHQEATFSLFVRKLPGARNYLLACGLDDALRYLERLRFTPEDLEYLTTFDTFSADFLDWLADFRFTGDVYAVPEGTPVFADEPLLEVVAPLPEAQLAETFIMNQVHLQTVLASKAARLTTAAGHRAVVDFGLRRMHGADAGLKAARAFYIAGIAATSNVLAGRVYGIPVTGTMGHSYIQAHDREADAFRAFAELYPSTILLVDTYDTIDGVKEVVRLAGALGDRFQVRGIRLDSGDLGALAFACRDLLDDAGLEHVEILASGGLDEFAIAKIVESGAPITGFGVGTDLGVSRDEPALDIAYKLTDYAGRGRLKLSSGKEVLPGRKQIFRVERDDQAVEDILARPDEQQPGRPLIRRVMEGGRRTCREPLAEIRERACRETARLPRPIQALAAAAPAYPVRVSRALAAYRDAVARLVRC